MVRRSVQVGLVAALDVRRRISGIVAPPAARRCGPRCAAAVSPAGMRRSSRAEAVSATRLAARPPSMVPILTVTAPKVRVSPAPEIGSETGAALAIAAAISGGPAISSPASACRRASPLISVSIALLPRWTWAPCAGLPVAARSSHSMPFSPKRSTRGEPASPQIIASPRISGTVSIRNPVPAVPMVSSSPARARTISPAQALAVLRHQRQGEHRACDPALHVRNAAAVEPPVPDCAGQRISAPGAGIADRVGVQMSAEHQPSARRGALEDGNDVGDRRDLRMAGDFNAVDLREQLGADRSDGGGIARRAGAGRAHQKGGRRDQSLARLRHAAAQPRARIHVPRRRRQAWLASTRPSTANPKG